MSAECPGCGGPVNAIPGYESRTTYCSRACQVRANRRRNRKGVADLAAEVERLRPVVDAAVAWAEVWAADGEGADDERRALLLAVGRLWNETQGTGQ